MISPGLTGLRREQNWPTEVLTGKVGAVSLHPTLVNAGGQFADIWGGPSMESTLPYGQGAQPTQEQTGRGRELHRQAGHQDCSTLPRPLLPPPTFPLAPVTSGLLQYNSKVT